MTLTEFVTSVCIEVFKEETPLSTGKKSTNTFITEGKLRKMMEDGSIDTLSESCKFTPLAYDLYKAYINKK